MNNVVVRAISGAVYVAVLVGAVIAGGVWFYALLCLLNVLALREFILMGNGGKFPRVASVIDILAGIALQTAVYGSFSLDFRLADFSAISFVALLLLRMISQLYSEHPDTPVNSVARSLMSQIYISLPLAILGLLRYAYGTPFVLAMLIFIWLNDTGAFCVGCTLGRHKLFERISPKKTWEGFFGGVFFALIGALVLKLGFGNHYYFSLIQMFLMAVVVSVMATYGDLFESMIKRTAGVKDSGNIIPGHGGILDRIDSILFVAPSLMLLLIIM